MVQPRLHNTKEWCLCRVCGTAMAVDRRSPHPRLGDRFELQSLRCNVCKHSEIRAVERDGA